MGAGETGKANRSLILGMVKPFFTLMLMLQAGSAAAQGAAPEDTVRLVYQARLEHPQLGESSGLAASRRDPGLLWTVNDSGNPPELFAVDSSGRGRAVFRIREAENRDWEALALARCGERDCLYIADVGDNSQRQRSVRIYQVPEPITRSSTGGAVDFTGLLELTYEDGPRNVEAIFVTGDQDVYLISKERAGGGRLYSIGREAWESRSRATARFIQELPFPDGLGYQVTDGALAANGVDVAIRTYRYIFFFQLEGGRLVPNPERPRCEAGGLDAQGEGITWLGSARLATTSERVMGLGGTISVVECR